MNAPFITSDDADRLNAKVQSQVDRRLYLCCNYTPSPCYALSQDAQYLAGVLDLYRFAIDSSCIIKNYYLFLSRVEKGQFSSLRRDLDTIRMLRSVLAHNQDPSNGRLSQEQLKEYEDWIAKTLHKAAPPSSQEDFSLLNRELADIARNLQKELDRFICCVASHADKEALIHKWIDQTLYWYTNNTARDLYYSQVESEYIRRSIGAGQDPSRLDFRLRHKVDRWIEQALFTPLKRELARIKTSLDSIERVLAAPPIPKSQLGDPRWEAVLNNLRQKKLDLLKEQECKTSQVDDLRAKADNNGKYTAYFFSVLKTDLLEMMVQLERDGIPYTLLPQDLLAMHVKEFFRDVPSPDMNF